MYLIRAFQSANALIGLLRYIILDTLSRCCAEKRTLYGFLTFPPSFPQKKPEIRRKIPGLRPENTTDGREKSRGYGHFGSS